MANNNTQLPADSPSYPMLNPPPRPSSTDMRRAPFCVRNESGVRAQRVTESNFEEFGRHYNVHIGGYLVYEAYRNRCYATGQAEFSDVFQQVPGTGNTPAEVRQRYIRRIAQVYATLYPNGGTIPRPDLAADSGETVSVPPGAYVVEMFDPETDVTTVRIVAGDAFERGFAPLQIEELPAR